MTLEEAILHAKLTAEEIDNQCEHYEIAGVNVCNGRKCAEEHRQLAEWLKELQQYRELFDSPEEAADVLNISMV